MPDFGYEIKQRLVALPTERDQKLEGASDEEIQALEQYAGGPFPSVYKQFLKSLGRSAGELLRGTEYSVTGRDRLRLREPAERLLQRKQSSFVLPDTAFVFLMSQGYQFSFFFMNQGNDPPVYHYHEGDGQPTQLASSLSNYLFKCIDACEERNTLKQSG